MQETGDGAQTPPFPRHLLHTSDQYYCTLHLHSNETQEHIEVGSLYEIDHSKLPPRTPVQLRSIRVVMVSEKTEFNVSVRFPTIPSLQSYLSNKIREMYPELNERFVMGTKLAEKVLFRQVPSQEFEEKKQSEEFWLVICKSSFCSDILFSNKGQNGFCLSELKSEGMTRWGVRRQVKFIGQHRAQTQSSSSIVRGGGKTEKSEQNEEEEKEEEAAETKKISSKRKRYSSRIVQNAKKTKREINKKNKKSNTKQMLVLKTPQHRWSDERYKLAVKNLMEVMKEKGAVFGNPILRLELRAEARKRIGDTGLLDHLLKHMAGKVAPGGDKRFRRRHNAEGVMEFWLESAELVDLRREVEIEDPYWTPPMGWKPGDCPTQDPTCALELKQLKEETNELEREFKELVSKKQMEEELGRLRREMEELLLKKEEKENQAIVVSNPCGISEKSELDSSLITLENYKEQLMVVSEYMHGIEEEIGKLKSKLEQGTRSPDSDSALMVSTEGCAEKEESKALAIVPQQQQEVATERAGADQIQRRKSNITEKETERTTAAAAGGGGGGGGAASAAAAEEKAAKIQRLKSGFRLCKPQGSFLWPNTNNTTKILSSHSKVVVQVEDLLVVPTPTSVSSSTASAPPQLPYNYNQHQPASPVKPLAERRAVTVTVSAVGDNNFSTTTTTTTTTSTNNILINLNDCPTSPQEEFCGTPSSSSRQLTITNTTVKPHVGTWLALATPTHAPDDSTRG